MYLSALRIIKYLYKVRKNQQIKYNPFENLEDKDTMYWLGILATDGCLSENSKICIFQKEESRDLIEKFQKFLNYNVKIQKVVEKKDITKYKKSFYTRYGISFRNKEVHNYLSNIGITPKKSFTLTINCPITWDFLRGVIDGDGTMEFYSDHRKRVRICSASKEFLLQISEFLNQNNIYHNIYTSKSQNKSKIHSLNINGDENLIKLLRFLYKDADTYLERKYLNAAQIRNNLIEKYSKLRETASAILKQADF